MKVLITQPYPTLWDSMDYSPLDSSLHGILQARILEWVAMPISRESSQPIDWIQVSRIMGSLYNLGHQRSPFTFTFRGVQHQKDYVKERIGELEDKLMENIPTEQQNKNKV